MTAVKDYKKEFVQRTKEIIEGEYNYFGGKNREVTFLLNCLLGLVVAVCENEKSSAGNFKVNIDDNFLRLIPDKIGFVTGCNYCGDNDLINNDQLKLETIVPVFHKDELRQKSKSWFVNKIRNAIAHQNIDSDNDSEKWKGVRLWNEFNMIKDFEIVFSIDELKKLAIVIADIYLGNSE